MRVLAIETSGRVGSVALLEAGGDQTTILAERRTSDAERTARTLLPTIQDLLRQQKWQPADVNLVCVTTGPGSFTGLRIGVVTAKTFAYATAARLVGVHTLTAIAAGLAARGAASVWAVLDAQRQELFAARFSSDALLDQAVPATEILAIPDWIQRLAPGDVVAGPPLAKLRELLPDGVVAADERCWEPSAAIVGAFGVELLRQGAEVSPLELVPHYYRKSAAEEKAAKK